MENDKAIAPVPNATPMRSEQASLAQQAANLTPERFRQELGWGLIPSNARSNEMPAWNG